MLGQKAARFSPTGAAEALMLPVPESLQLALNYTPVTFLLSFLLSRAKRFRDPVLHGVLPGPSGSFLGPFLFGSLAMAAFWFCSSAELMRCFSASCRCSSRLPKLSASAPLPPRLAGPRLSQPGARAGPVGPVGPDGFPGLPGCGPLGRCKQLKRSLSKWRHWFLWKGGCA